MNAEERFWAKVKKTLFGCWEWQAAIVPTTGYGAFTFESYKVVSAHVFSWILKHGPVPKGMCVLHECDNRKCVRPSHLWLGTRDDNMQDMIQKGRAIHACGSQSSAAKLTEEIVRKARVESKNTITAELARKYGVTHATMSRVLERKT